MLSGLGLVGMLVIGYTALLCRKTDPFYYKQVRNFFRFLIEAGLFALLFMVILVLAGELFIPWLFTLTVLPDILIISGIIAAGLNYIRYERNTIRWAIYTGNYAKFEPDYQYGNVDDMTNNQIRDYTQHIAKYKLQYYGNKRSIFDFLRMRYL